MRDGLEQAKICTSVFDEIVHKSNMMSQKLVDLIHAFKEQKEAIFLVTNSLSDIDKSTLEIKEVATKNDDSSHKVFNDFKKHREEIDSLSFLIEGKSFIKKEAA